LFKFRIKVLENKKKAQFTPLLGHRSLQLYIHTTKLVRGIPIVTSTLRTFTEAPSSSLSASSPSRDSSEEYPEIGASACVKSAEDSRLILMVALNGDQSRNSSSGYPTIGRSETSDAQTPSAGLVQNLNPDFNAVRVQAIMETIHRMAPDGSPLALLAQQGAEAANLVVAEKTASGPRREPSAGHNNRARRARSEAASSASPNQHLAENDARQRICCRLNPPTGVDRQHESRKVRNLYPSAMQLARALRLEFVGRAT
jgi:hypothetical protein